MVLSATVGFGTVVPMVLVDNVLKPATRPILAWIVITLGLGTVALALSWSTPIVVGLALGTAMLLRLTRRAEREHASSSGERHAARVSTGQLASEFWRFSAPRAFAGAFEAVLLRLDILLVGGLATTTVAGIYAASSRLIVVGGFALGAVITAISPLISSALAVRDHARAETLFQTTTWWLMLPSWPVYLVLAIFAPTVLRLLGADYLPGQVVLTSLSLAMLLNMATGPVSTVLLMGGYSGWNLANTGIAVVASVGLNVLLVPRFGLTGAAIAGAVSIVCVELASAIEVRILLHLTPFGRGFSLVAIASTMCYAVPGLVLRALVGPSIASLVACVVVGTIPYLLIMRRNAALLRLRTLGDALRRRSVDDVEPTLGATVSTK